MNPKRRPSPRIKGDRLKKDEPERDANERFARLHSAPRQDGWMPIGEGCFKRTIGHRDE